MKKERKLPSPRKGALKTAKRSFALLLLFAIAFSYLNIRLFCLQVFGYAEAQQKVMDEITVSSGLRARRGSILDTNGIPLATTRTTYRIFASPKNIATAEKKERPGLGDRIAEGLSDILDYLREDEEK